MAAYIFLGEALALDFANTEIALRGKRRSLIQTPTDLAAWWLEAAAQYPALQAAAAPIGKLEDGVINLAVALALRTAIRGLISARSTDGPIAADQLETLNQVLATGHEALVVQPPAGLQRVYRTRDTGFTGRLLAIALSALEQLTAPDAHRLHQCANARCILLFRDTTRSATRQFCSTACRDRVRSSQRYHQAHTGTAPVPGEAAAPVTGSAAADTAAGQPAALPADATNSST